MKKVFRSILDIKKSGKSTIPQDELVLNYRSFLASNVKPDDPSFIKIYHWIEAHYRQHHEVPDISLINSRAEREGDEAILASLKDIAQETPYIRSNYKEVLKEKFDEQCKEQMQILLQKVWQIAYSGYTEGKKKEELKGIGTAREYFINESRKFVFGEDNVKTEGNIKSTQDSNEVIEQYRERKKNPPVHMGMYTGLEKIDDCCRGLKPGELMLIAAYVGQGKTTLSANLAYNGIWQGLNGLFIPLEMNFTEMRDFIYVLHSCNPEWYEKAPKFKNLIGKISYDKVVYGELSDMEQEFFEMVSKDFHAQESFGELFIKQPDKGILTPSQVEMYAYEYDLKLKEKGKKLDWLLVDYIGLMYPDKSDRYGDFNVDLNSVIKRLKGLAINFDNGRALRVMSPFQVNRNGFREAEKNDGVFHLSALSNANEAERACDLVISCYMSKEMKRSGTIKIGCLKHRKGYEFTPFDARVDFNSKHIYDMIQPSRVDEEDSLIQEIPVDIS